MWVFKVDWWCLLNVWVGWFWNDLVLVCVFCGDFVGVECVVCYVFWFLFVGESLVV